MAQDRSLVELSASVQPPGFGGERSLLLRWKQPVIFRGVTCEYFHAAPRHAGIEAENLLNGERVSFNISRVPAGVVEMGNPFDPQHWGADGSADGSLIADLRLLEETGSEAQHPT